MQTNLDLLPSIMLSSQDNINANASSKDKEQLKEACNEFEAILLGHLLRSMKATIPKGGFLAKGTATKLFEEMLDDQLAREIAKSSSLGLGQMMLQELAEKEAPKSSK
jgi:flagellar protein FlgJ